MKDLKHLKFKTDKIRVAKDIDYGGSSKALFLPTSHAGGVETLRVVSVRLEENEEDE